MISYSGFCDRYSAMTCPAMPAAPRISIFLIVLYSLTNRKPDRLTNPAQHIHQSVDGKVADFLVHHV